MKRIGSIGLACTAFFSMAFAAVGHATPTINGAHIETRTFDDCHQSTLTTTNNYPASISITDVMDPGCVGFANLHSFSFSADGGTTAAVFNNDDNFHFGGDFKIEGPGEGEGGLRLSPWYGQYVDGRFMANATTHEVACFGGAIPFYSFTANFGINYVKGTTIHMELTYIAHDLTMADPATIQYRVIYNGNTYDSPVLQFGEQNEAECVHGLWGMLNDGRAGGYFQPRANTSAALAATWSNITFQCLAPVGTPLADAATIQTRTFDDCHQSTLTTTNNYPASISITDVMDPGCVGFANLHSWTFSADGGTTSAEFDDNANFHFGADFKIDGAGEGEGGLRVSPWYGQYVDGRIMANATTHEVACFGGAIPFYSFTANFGVTYVKGTTIHMEVSYSAHELISTDPATIQYHIVYNGNTYDSPVLQFGEQNEAECVHGLWGMLNDGRVGGYFQPRANTGAALSATWSNITYAPCGQVGTVAIRPEKLNTNSHGRLVTAFIEPPTGSSPSDIDVGSILLNGSLGVAGGSPSEVVNFGGAPSLLVKFSRFGLIGAVGGSGSVTVTGLIGCDCFAATGQVDPVALPALAQPADGSVLSGGAETQVQWQKTSDPTVDLVSSYDGGATWNIEAENIPNTGSYTWSVPSVNASGVRLGVVEIAFADPTGLVTDAELGESGGFQIASAAGVGDGALSFALRKVWPSPARGAFSVTFSLPTSGRATLSLFDVGGRLVTSREVGALGAGLHSVTLGQREALRPGLYLVRLTQAGKSLTGRALVVQ